MFEQIQHRRAVRAAKNYLKSVGSVEAMKIFHSVAMLDAFVDECIMAQRAECEGPIVDVIGKVIESFLNDPEKWIAVIKIVIALFS